MRYNPCKKTQPMVSRRRREEGARMKGMNARPMRMKRALAWIVLALFALAFIGFFGHFGCCHPHEDADEICPFCETFIRYIRLLRTAGLIGLACALLSSLSISDAGFRMLRTDPLIRKTLVSLRVKLTD